MRPRLGAAPAILGLLGVGVSAGTALLISRLHVSSATLPILITIVAIGCVVMIWVGYAVSGDVFFPLVVLGGIFLVLFVFRPIYILGSGRIGPTRLIDDEALNDLLLRSMGHAEVLVLLAIVFLVLGCLCAMSLNKLTYRGFSRLPSRLRADAVGPVPAPLYFALAASASVEIVGYAGLIRQAGGLSAYISSLSDRSAVFLDRGYLTLVGVPLKVCAFVLLAKLLLSPSSRWPRVVLVTCIGLTAFGDFLTGGRAALLIGTVLPLLVIVHWLRAPLKARWLITILALALLFFVAARVATRDSQYAANGAAASPSAIASLTWSELSDLPKSTIGGRDAVIFDSITMLVRAQGSGLSYQWGRTFLPILSFPVPRSVWPAKPLGGGNTWFTETLYPGFFGRARGARTETSISVIGDLDANFGPGGIALGCVLIGFLSTLLYVRALTDRSLWSTLLYAVSIGYLLTLFRGDAFHSVTSWVVTVVLAYGACRLAFIRSPSGAARVPPEAAMSLPSTSTPAS